jgi:hypothetical protein
VYGPLTIVGIQDIGPLWPREGKPVAYHWPVYIHAARLIIPLILLALLLRKPNRRLSAWWALFPTLALPVAALWVAKKMVEEMGETMIEGVTGFLGDSITLILFAMAFLWLTADRLGNQPRPKAFAGVMGMLALAGSIGLLGVSALGFDAMLILKAFVYAVFVAVFLAVMALTAFESRKRYTPLRFLIRFFIILVVGISAVGTLLSMLLMTLAGFFMGGGFDMDYLAEIVMGQMMGSAFIGLVLFLLMLPFLALALWCPVYRQRFHAILRLPGMQPAEDSVYNGLTTELPMTGEEPPAGGPPVTTDGL